MIRLFWLKLQAQTEASLHTLCESNDFQRSAEDVADICVYGHEYVQSRVADSTPPGHHSKAIVIGESDLLGSDSFLDDCDFILPLGVPAPFLKHVIKQAVRQLELGRQNHNYSDQVLHEQEQFRRLMDIGLAMSAEQDHQTLLERILREARRFGECDAASIFLVDRSQQVPELVFKLTQNDSLSLDFKEQHFALDDSSLAGHAALSGDVLNIADV